MQEVVFYVNGPARLLMACVIADERYPSHRKHLILLNQFGYNYDALLPHVEHKFATIHLHTESAAKYFHLDQLLGVYVRSFKQLRACCKPGREAVLFGIRSPAQKTIIRESKRLGNRVVIYAESLAVDRYFRPRTKDSPLRALGRRLLARAFDYQHDYDVFYVHNRQMYQGTPHAHKIHQMFDLFRSNSFARYSDLLLRDVDLRDAMEFDTVFFGQPLSNFDGLISHTEEVEILRQLIADRRVLVLPHPNEKLGHGDKYAGLPRVKVLRTGLPNDLLALRLRPRVTMTYSSTIGLNYAVANPDSMNYFYPIHKSLARTVRECAAALPNVVVSEEFVREEHSIRRPSAPS